MTQDTSIWVDFGDRLRETEEFIFVILPKDSTCLVAEYLRLAMMLSNPRCLGR